METDHHIAAHALRGGPVAVAAVGCAVAIAACGGSGSKSGSRYGAANSPYALSRCMRANGLSNFPDPTAGPGGEGFNGITVTNTGLLIVDGIQFGGPALKTAEKACAEYLPPAGGPPPQISASQQRKALAFARCMRSHGVPSFPDPNFSAAPSAPPPDLNPQSPAFESAAKACGLNGHAIVIGP